MLQRSGIEVSLRRTKNGKEMDTWLRQSSDGLPVEVISIRDFTSFYPVVFIRPAFAYDPNVNGFKIEVCHGQCEYHFRVEIKKPYTSATSVINLGDCVVKHWSTGAEMPLNRALYTGVGDRRISSSLALLIDL